MRVRSHVLKDGRFGNWRTEVEGRWSYRQLYDDPAYRDEWVSFDCLAWHPRDEVLYVGLTLMNNDIFYRFDPGAEKFESLGFQRIADRFDAKFHRSLELDVDGALWAATALLHDPDDQHRAPGGKLVRFDPASDRLEQVAVPVPHQYIQNLRLDAGRRVLYGFTYPAEYFFAYDIDAGSTRLVSFVGNGIMVCQPHGFVIEPGGAVWGTWGESRAFEDAPGPAPIKLFRYDPDSREVEYFRHGLPRVGPGDRGTVDHMTLGRDGTVWVGTSAGALARLDPSDASVTYVGKPFPGPRLAGLVEGSDGQLYLAGNGGFDDGCDGTSRLARMNPATGTFTDLGPLHDPERGVTAGKVHLMVETTPGRLFCGENDHITRSSYLWEVDVSSSAAG